MRFFSIILSAALFSLPLGAQVSSGIDALEQHHFAELKQMVEQHGGHLRLGLMTNHTGLDSHQRRTVDVLYKDAQQAVPGLKLVTLYSPEHGLTGALDTESIGNSSDAVTGLPIISLYGSTDSERRPSNKKLEGVDAVAIDLQDVGVRYYTYETVVGYFVEAAAANHKELLILDRPNPIAGLAVQGPLTTAGRENYISYYAEPVRHGMTLGELASFINGEKHLGAQLTVVKMEGWRRSMWFDETGLLWVNPSPNLRSLTQAILYPGTGLLEGSNVSVGRGTDTPFVRLGAPWIRSTELAAYLTNRKIPGVSFIPVFFTPGVDPQYPHYGKRCEGVEIVVNDRHVIDGPELGIEVASALWKLYPNDFQVGKMDKLLLNESVLNQIKASADPRSIMNGWQKSLTEFANQRTRYLLYQ